MIILIICISCGILVVPSSYCGIPLRHRVAAYWLLGDPINSKYTLMASFGTEFVYSSTLRPPGYGAYDSKSCTITHAAVPNDINRHTKLAQVILKFFFSPQTV